MLKKHTGFHRKVMSRRKYMTAVSGLLGVGFALLSKSSSTTTFLGLGNPSGGLKVIDKDYVLVDGWLLRVDDLF